MKHNWEYHPFSEIAQTITPVTKIDKSEYLPIGEIPIVSQEEVLISGFWNITSDVTPHCKPVVIFGDHSRVLKYVDFDFVVGADGVKILLPFENVNAKYLYWFLQWYNIPSLGYARHFRLVKEARYPVPPKEVQEQIVAELDEINAMIEVKKEQIKQLDLLAQSIFYDTFGDPVTNPKGWETVNLGSIIEPKKKIIRASKIFEKNRCILYIDISSINRVNHSIENPSKFIFEDAPSRAQQVSIVNDVLVSLVRPNLKNIAINNYDCDNIVASTGFCILRCIQGLSNSKFIFYTLLSESATDYLCSKINGAAYPAITEDTLRKMLLSVPPIKLQEQFAAKVEAIEERKKEIEETMKELKTLLDSRMDYWFN